MKIEHINTLATSVIALVTTIVAMFGFYYNLRQIGAKAQNIIIWEIAFIISILVFIRWVKQRSDGHDNNSRYG